MFIFQCENVEPLVTCIHTYRLFSDLSLMPVERINITHNSLDSLTICEISIIVTTVGYSTPQVAPVGRGTVNFLPLQKTDYQKFIRNKNSFRRKYGDIKESVGIPVRT